MNALISKAIVGLIWLCGLCAGTQKPDVHVLFTRLNAYGFFLDLPNQKDSLAQTVSTVQQHLSALCPRDRGSMNIKMTSLDGGHALIRNFKKHAAQTLNTTAMSVAIEMELMKDACVSVLPEILGSTDPIDTRLILMAASNLKMKWLQDEILARTGMNDPKASFYALLKKFAINKDYYVAQNIIENFNTRAYADLHPDVRAFCLEARDSDRGYDIEEVQRWFCIVNQRNVQYFMNEELFFVIEQFEYSELTSIRIPRSMLGDQNLKQLLCRGHQPFLHHVPLETLQRNMVELLQSETDKLCLMRAVDLFISKNLLESIESLVDSKMLEFLSTVAQSPYRMKAFLAKNPEYVDKASLTWIAERRDPELLRVFFDRMRVMGGVAMVLDEEVSTKLMILMTYEDKQKFLGTGLELTFGYSTVNCVIRPSRKCGLLKTCKIRVPRYDMAIVKYICEHGPVQLRDQLRKEMNNDAVLDAYARQLESELKESYRRFRFAPLRTAE